MQGTVAELLQLGPPAKVNTARGTPHRDLLLNSCTVVPPLVRENVDNFIIHESRHAIGFWEVSELPGFYGFYFFNMV